MMRRLLALLLLALPLLGARNFDDASSEYLDSTIGASVTTTPLSGGCWLRADDLTVRHGIFAVYTSGSNNQLHELYVDGAAGGDPSRINSRTTTNANADSSTGPTVNVYSYISAVVESATSRYAYVDGTPGTQGTTNRAPSGMNATRLGADVFSGGAPVLWISGDLAECAIWSVILTPDEITALAKGFSPLLVRPSSLEGYWSLAGNASPEPDFVRGINMTLQGTPTKGEHPRIYHAD